MFRGSSRALAQASSDIFPPTPPRVSPAVPIVFIAGGNPQNTGARGGSQSSVGATAHDQDGGGSSRVLARSRSDSCRLRADRPAVTHTLLLSRPGGGAARTAGAGVHRAGRARVTAAAPTLSPAAPCRAARRRRSAGTVSPRGLGREAAGPAARLGG